MASPTAPGPDAARAFKTGIWTAALVGLAFVGVLYWQGMLSGYVAVFVLVIIFPVYLLVAASVLSKWLGYDKDMTDLRPVTMKNDEGPFSGGGPW